MVVKEWSAKGNRQLHIPLDHKVQAVECERKNIIIMEHPVGLLECGSDNQIVNETFTNRRDNSYGVEQSTRETP